MKAFSLRWLLLLMACVLPVVAHAQYPNKLIRIIVPFLPGAPPDLLARAVGDRLAVNLGQPVIVENRPGAGSNIGAEALVKAPNDGYTLMLAAVFHASNPSLYQRVNYDPVKDFAPISLVARIPALLVVHVDSSARTVQDLIALAKARPGALTYASGSNGSQAHFAGELFKRDAGIEILHVPYKGSPELVASLLGKHTSLGFPVLAAALPHVQSGKLRALAVTSAKRHTKLPDVPTMREAMSPGFELDAWFGIVAPAGVPPDIVTRLNVEIVKILRDPAVRDRLTADGTAVVTSTPEELAALIKNDVAEWADIVKQTGVKID